MAIYERIETTLLHGDKAQKVILHRHLGDSDRSDEVEYLEAEPVQPTEEQATTGE